MCPMCIGVATWYLAGASSAGGIAALVVKRSSSRNQDRRTAERSEAESELRPYAKWSIDSVRPRATRSHAFE
jgi:hypothetical protein